MIYNISHLKYESLIASRLYKAYELKKFFLWHFVPFLIPSSSMLIAKLPSTKYSELSPICRIFLLIGNTLYFTSFCLHNCFQILILQISFKKCSGWEFNLGVHRLLNKKMSIKAKCTDKCT